MPDLKISEMNSAAPLTGTEVVAGVQGGGNVKITTQAIADLSDPGITNSAANNELMKSDGTNAVASGLFSTVGGNINLGTGTSGTSRTIQADGSGSDVGLSMRSKGSGASALINFIINSISRLSIWNSGNVSIGNTTDTRRLSVENQTAATNTVTYVQRLTSSSTGTPAAGIGVGLELAAQTGAANTEIGATIEAVTTDVAGGSEDFDLVTKQMQAGAAAIETLRITPNAGSNLITYTLGAGASGTNREIVAGATGSDANISVKVKGSGIALLQGSGSAVTLNPNQAIITGNTDVTVNGVVFTTGGVSNNSSGIKHARVSTGSIAAGTSALVTVTWGTAFSNTSYTVTASVTDSTSATASLSVVHVESISTTQVQVRVVNNSAGSITGTLHVIAIHD